MQILTPNQGRGSLIIPGTGIVDNYLDVFYASGKNVYIRLVDAKTGKWWTGTTTETWQDAHVTSYGVAVTEAVSSGYYRVLLPSGLPAGTWDYSGYERAGGSQSISDSQIVGSSKRFEWNGTSAIQVVTPGAMSVSAARDWIRQWNRNANLSDEYDDAEIDRVVQVIGNILRDKTGYGRVHSTITVSANSNTADFSTISGFAAGFIRRAWIENQRGDLTIGTYEMARNALLGGQSPYCDNGADSPYYLLGSSAETIKMLGFLTETEAKVAWTVTADTDIEILWQPPFTVWTPGDTGADNLALNLPYGWLVRAFPFGGAILQMREPEHAENAIAANAEFKKIVDDLRYGSGLGEQMYVAGAQRVY